MTRVSSRGEGFGIGFGVQRLGTDDYNMMRVGMEVAGVGHAPHRFPPFPRERMGHPHFRAAEEKQIPRLRLVMTNRKRDDKRLEVALKCAVPPPRSAQKRRGSWTPIPGLGMN